jgi:uncharacterized protein (TIGR03435 family)
MTHGISNRLNRGARLLAPSFGLMILSVSLAAQPQIADSQLAFEVASIKPSGPDAMRGPLLFPPGGRFTVPNLAVRMIIQGAYSVRSVQLTAGPSWLYERYEIQAKIPEGTFDEGQIKSMLQNLLAERFQLKLHHETKEFSIYALVVAKGGVKLQESKDDKSRSFAGIGFGSITATRSTLDALCRGLSELIDRPVFNETNLAGSYDLKMHFDPDSTQGRHAPPGSAESSEPSIFTALQEQLGLKLEPKNKLVDILVIDHIERPTPN